VDEFGLVKFIIQLLVVDILAKRLFCQLGISIIWEQTSQFFHCSCECIGGRKTVVKPGKIHGLREKNVVLGFWDVIIEMQKKII